MITRDDVVDYLILVLSGLPLWVLCYSYEIPLYYSFPCIIMLMASAFVRGRWA
jgi:hypothetical protein